MEFSQTSPFSSDCGSQPHERVIILFHKAEGSTRPIIQRVLVMHHPKLSALLYH